MRPNSILHAVAWMLILAAAINVPVASGGGPGGTGSRETNETESLGIHPERCPEVLEKLCPDGANTGAHCQEMSEICQRVYFSKIEAAPAPRTATTPETPRPAAAEDRNASSGEEEEEEESSDEVADPEPEGDVSDGSFDDTSVQDDTEEATEDEAVVEEEAGSEEESEEYDNENVENADVEEEAGNEEDADEYETDNEDADTDQGDE
jgi:hypothetical protein